MGHSYSTKVSPSQKIVFPEYKDGKPSLLMSLPKEIWRYNICSYLTKQELHCLRITSQFFLKEIFIFPFWKQWVPLEQVKAFQSFWKGSKSFFFKAKEEENEEQKKFPFLYGICVSSNVILQNNSFSDIDIDISTQLKALDLSNSFQRFTIEFFSQLSFSLEEVIFPYNSHYVTQEIIRFFLESNSNLKIRFYHLFKGYTSLLYWSFNKNYDKIMELALANRNEIQSINQVTTFVGDSVFHLACASHSVFLVEKLLNLGADINCVRKEDNKTGLMLACQKGNYAVIQLLYEREADIGLKDIEGKSAKDLYIEARHTEKLMF